MLDIRQMVIFSQVVETGSFSAAARRLGQSRSAISKSITNLEKSLGVRLLSRSTRHLSLTEIGTAFVEHCRRISEEVEQAKQLVDSLHLRPSGTLRVAASVAFGTLHIAPALSDFLTLYPEIDIDMTIIDRPVDLVEEKFDVVIRVCQIPPENVVARKIAPASNRLCATPEYLKKYGIPQKPEDLSSHNCLDYIHSGEDGIWRFAGPQGSISVPISGRLRINDDDALSQAVLGGLGLAILPTFLIGKHLQTGRLSAVLTEYLPTNRHIYAIYLSARNQPAKIRAFVEFLYDRFGPEPYWDNDND